MVDAFGRWTYEQNTPEDKKCDLDRLADWIMESGYKPKIGVENLAIMIMVHFDCPDNFGAFDPATGSGGYGENYTLEECKRYVKDSGGFSEFDYVA